MSPFVNANSMTAGRLCFVYHFIGKQEMEHGTQYVFSKFSLNYYLIRCLNS